MEPHTRDAAQLRTGDTGTSVATSAVPETLAGASVATPTSTAPASVVHGGTQGGAALADLIPLLDAALRSRVSTSTRLAELTGTPLADIERQLAALERLGFVSMAAGEISYRRPDAAAAALTEQLVTGLAPQIAEVLSRAQGALGSIPGLLHAWDEGANGRHRLQVDVLHGPLAPADMWRLQFSRRVPRTTAVCMPSTAALFAVQEEHQASFWASRSDQDVDVRLLMSVADATHPAGRDRIRGELDAGVEIRMHPQPPSFFWITDDNTVGLPLTWGETWPTSVIAIQSPVLAESLLWIYERIWHEAVPVDPALLPQDGPVWDPILQLMHHGLTMDAAAHVLGIAPRTARRRVADAMVHYRATSQFSLGAAWATAQRA